MKKQLYKLTAKHDCETEWASFEKDDEVYTYQPDDYGSQNFTWELWDESWPLVTENQFQPNYAVAPGETLLEVLQMNGISLQELSELTHIEHTALARIADGTGAITPDVAESFEKVTGIKQSFWNNLEANYRKTLKRIEESK